MKHTFTTAVLLLMCFAAAAQAKQTYTFAVRDTALRLDVWQPATKRPDRACVVAVFGGGFVSGSRDNELQTTIAKQLTSRGYTVVSPDYRLGLKDSAMLARYGSLWGMQRLFQWCMDIAAEDCAAAVAYVVANAERLGIDPERVVLTGSSAGAIAVLQLDYCRANSLPEASALPQGWQPAAVVAYAGAVGCKGKPTYATPPAPTLLMHGTKDRIVNYRRYPPLLRHAVYGGSTLYKIFKRNHYPVWIVRYKGIGHEVASFLPGSVELFCGYVEQVLAGRRTTIDATAADEALQPTEWTKMNVFDLYK